MNRYMRAFAALAIAAVPLAGCAPHLKKLDNATKGPYRYANPNGVTLPEQPVPSVDDMIPQPLAPVGPTQETAPAPPLPYSVPASPVGPAPAPPKPDDKEGAMLLLPAGHLSGVADHA